MMTSRDPSPAASGVREPAFRAVNGQLYRLSETSGWWPMDDAFAARLWAVYAATSQDTSDWFHSAAGRLGGELANAIRDGDDGCEEAPNGRDLICVECAEANEADIEDLIYAHGQEATI